MAEQVVAFDRVDDRQGSCAGDRFPPNVDPWCRAAGGRRCPRNSQQRPIGRPRRALSPGSPDQAARPRGRTTTPCVPSRSAPRPRSATRRPRLRPVHRDNLVRHDDPGFALDRFHNEARGVFEVRDTAVLEELDVGTSGSGHVWGCPVRTARPSSGRGTALRGVHGGAPSQACDLERGLAISVPELQKNTRPGRPPTRSVALPVRCPPGASPVADVAVVAELFGHSRLDRRRAWPMALTAIPATMSRYRLPSASQTRSTLTAHDRDRRCAVVVRHITVCQRRVSIAVVFMMGPPPLSPPRNR